MPLRPNHTTEEKPKVRERWGSGPIGDFYGDVALGNSTQYRMMLSPQANGLFVGVEGKGCYTFCGYADAGYVKDKLGLRYEGDAANIADLINAVNGTAVNGYSLQPAQGTYARNLCNE